MPIRLHPRGVLVAFEGIDGAGKTTQAALLEEWTRPTGIEVVRTKEPTSGKWGKLLRESASTGRLSPEDELHAFLEDRREHVSLVIEPALGAGCVVIVDRYYFSTAAYQGARGHDPQELLRLNETFAPRPDLLVLLEISPRVAMERIQRRGDLGNLFEKEDDLGRSATIFAGLSAPYLLRLDGTLNQHQLSNLIVNRLYTLPPVVDAVKRRYPPSDEESAGASVESAEALRTVEAIAKDHTLSPADKLDAVRRLFPRRTENN